MITKISGLMALVLFTILGTLAVVALTGGGVSPQAIAAMTVWGTLAFGVFLGNTAYRDEKKP